MAGSEGCQQDSDKDRGTCQDVGQQQNYGGAANRGTGDFHESRMRVYRRLFFPQKLRFKKIAEVAATRVERMRDLLIRSELISVDPDPLEKKPYLFNKPLQGMAPPTCIYRAPSPELSFLSSFSQYEFSLLSSLSLSHFSSL